MALVEYDLFGEKRDKVKTAIDRLQAFEPQEGYYVADSGGKDSTCVVKLCEMAGVKFDAHYHARTDHQKSNAANAIDALLLPTPQRAARSRARRGYRCKVGRERKPQKEPRACDVYNRDQRATQRSGFERCRAKSDGQRRNYPQHRQRREPQNG